MRLFAVVAVAILIAGCTGITPTVNPVWNQPCTIYQDFGATKENSLIAAKVENPCAAQRILVTAAEMPFVWSGAGYFEKFGQWSAQVQQAITSGITYSALQLLVAKKVAEFNSEAGIVLLIVSNNLFIFEGEIQPINDMDKRLLLAALNDLRVRVANMGLAYQAPAKK